MDYQSEVKHDCLYTRGWNILDRLNESLGFLGVFYNREENDFFNKLSKADRKKLISALNSNYLEVLSNYFIDRAKTNKAIEDFVNACFFSDLPLTKVLEIHSVLLEEFWKEQEKEETENYSKKDYHVVLIDVMSHLCEMYRRSIPQGIPVGSEFVEQKLSESLGFST